MSSLTFLGVGVKGAAEVAISEKHRSDCNRFVPMALSGNNLYLAWPNNDNGHWNVFFVRALTAERLYLTISAPNKGNTIDQKMQISASGSNVYVTWWTNKTGTNMPVFRAPNDNGDTFGRTIMLYSTLGD
ncbi:MAG: hypothetical protein WAZ77_11585 [Candidatus Nitrosopolaris sp.]